MKKLLAIKVTNRINAKPEAEGWADHVISVVDKGTPCELNHSQHIEFFEDLIDPLNGASPQKEHVQRILDFADRNFFNGQNILVHCEGGICRSTAVAILLHCQAGFDPQEAFFRVERQRPQLWPNELIIELGDEILGLDGELIEVVNDFMGKNDGKIFWDGGWEG